MTANERLSHLTPEELEFMRGHAVLCPFYFHCGPEVIRNPCYQNGFWNDRRRKDHPVGEECEFHKDIRLEREHTNSSKE